MHDRDTPVLGFGAAGALRGVSTVLFRYGLVVIIAWFGAFKFTPAEAQAIQPLVANSPLLSWLYAVRGEIGASRVILNVHYLSDVLAGVCLGLAWLSACLLVDAWLRSGRRSRDG